MKKSVVIITLLLLTASVNFAQNFKPFKLGIGFGYAVPAGGDRGGIFYLEPAYRASNAVLIGLRLENAKFSRELTGMGSNINSSSTSTRSYSLNVQYYFNENRVRPFIGVGLGFFDMAAATYNTGSEVQTVGAESKFGLYPRVGVDIGHLNLTLDYNIVPSTNVPGGGEVMNSYLGIRVGLSIGGGEGKK